MIEKKKEKLNFIEPSLNYLKETGWLIPSDFLKFDDLIELGEKLYKYSVEILEKDVLLASSIRSVAHGCYLMLQKDDIEKPLKQIWSNKDGTGSISLPGLKDEDLKIIEWIALNTSDSRITCRFNDILWLRNKNITAALAAVDAYLCEVRTCLEKKPEDLFSYLGELKRLLVISAQTGNRDQFKPKVLEIRDLGIKISSSCKPWQIAELLSEIVKWSPDLFDESIIDTLKRIAADSNLKKDFDAERSVYDNLVLIYRYVKKNSNARNYAETKAQSLASQARLFRKEGIMTALGLSHHYETAIEEYRKLGMRELARELYFELLEIQPSVQDDMKEYSHPMDLSKPAKNLIEYLEAKPNLQRIMILARYGRIVSKSEFYEQGKKLSEQSLASMCSIVKVNKKGRVVQRSSGSNPGDEKTAEQELVSACFPFTFHVRAQSALIDTGRYHLSTKNCILDSDFDFILQSPLISEDRRAAFKKGFIAGFRGDWLTSMSILIPQLENGIREICEQAGIIMTNMNQDMVQTEQSMTDYLYNNEEAIQFLGEDLVFNLKALFADEAGYNFRNLVAHGLVDDDDFESDIAIYTWSFIMRLAIDLRKLLYDQIYKKE